MELLGGLAAQKCSLPRLLHAVEISGAVCLLAAILLLLCCRRVRIGATLTATGLAALLLLLPALLLNLPGCSTRSRPSRRRKSPAHCCCSAAHRRFSPR